MSRKLKGSAIVDSSVTGTQIETALVNKITNAYNQANAAYGQANTGSTSGADAYNQANAAYGQANAAYGQANNARSDANTTFVTINTTFGTVNTSLGTVNTSLGTINTNYQAAYAQANTARDTANDAYGQANTGRTTANNAYASANLAYAAANNSNLKLGGLVSGTLNVTQDLIVGGNIYLEGNTTFINVATYSVEDSLIYMSSNNKLTDSVDIGFMGGKNTGGSYAHTGLARDATDGKWKLFDGLAEEGHVGNVVDFANTYLATLVANVEANTLTVVNGISGNVNFDSGTLFIDSAGNKVGIGTTSPNRLLDIENSTAGGSTLASLVSATDGNCQLLFGDTASDTRGKVVYDNVTDSMWFEANGAHRLRISSSGNVGIGTTSPSSKLHIVDGGILVTDENAGQAMLQMRNYATSATGAFDGTYGYEFRHAASTTTHGMLINNNEANDSRRSLDVSDSNGIFASFVNGKVGIGTTSPAEKLHVVGKIVATDDITAFYSDERLKTKLGNISNALEKIVSLNGFYFEPNEIAINYGYEKKTHVGVSAQEVEKVLPEIIAPAPIDPQYKAVQYEKMIPLLIEAIKELNEKIDKLVK